MTVTRLYNTVHSAWIRQFHDPAAEGPVVVCFPHAGGSASAYLPLSEELSVAAEVLLVQYPGRQDRLAEPAVDDIRQLADRAAHALLPWRGRPLALFGHSMGSLLAYEVALRLERRWGCELVGLLLSGRAAPCMPSDHGVHRLDDEHLARHLAHLAGTPAALLADKDLLATVLPSVRADFKAVETYEDRAGDKVGCAISTYSGRNDVGVPLEGLVKWADYTTGQWSVRLFDGGHFYVQSHTRELAQAMLGDLAALAAPDSVEHDRRELVAASSGAGIAAGVD